MLHGVLLKTQLTQETMLSQISELMRIFSNLMPPLSNPRLHLSTFGPQLKMVTTGVKCQPPMLTHLTFSLTPLQNFLKPPRQMDHLLLLVSQRDHQLLLTFNQILLLIQFALVPVALNTKHQRENHNTQWTISFQTSELIIKSKKRIAVNNGPLRKLDTPGFGKRKKNLLLFNTKSILLTLICKLPYLT